MSDNLLNEITRRFMDGMPSVDGNPMAAQYRTDVGYLLSTLDRARRVAFSIASNQERRKKDVGPPQALWDRYGDARQERRSPINSYILPSQHITEEAPCS
jgi:hypothetical protein